MDWITLVVVALVTILFVVIGILLRRRPSKRAVTREEQAARAEVDADSTLARGLTENARHEKRR